jgi:hypothetical protein
LNDRSIHSVASLKRRRLNEIDTLEVLSAHATGGKGNGDRQKAW